MVDLLFSWRFIEILRYKQTARSKPLTENCICTFDTAHHGSDQRIPQGFSYDHKKCRKSRRVFHDHYSLKHCRDNNQKSRQEKTQKTMHVEVHLTQENSMISWLNAA